MKTKPGRFEGHEVQAAILTLSGKSDDRVDVLDIDDTVYVLMVGSVAEISHGDMNVRGESLFVRKQKVKAAKVVLLDREKGEQMLTEASMMADDRFGIETLFTQADEVLQSKNALPPADGI